jgi:AraC-like DNA-binding protein
MVSGPTDFAPLRFSTAALPVRDRLAVWREVIGRQIVHIDIDPLSDGPFEAETTLRALPGLRTMTSVGAAARYRRTAGLIADGDDAVVLQVNLGGSMSVTQSGRTCSLGAGDAITILNSEPAAVEHAQSHFLAVVIPRAALAPRVTDVEGATMRVIPHGNEALGLLVSYLETVREDVRLATPELRHLAITHVHDLFALALGANRDGAAMAAERGRRAARLAATKADIVARLDRRDLSLDAVAARQHVTPRYIQLLFEREGITFSQFVLVQRLARAHRMLTSPSHAGWTVSAIALAAGFGDLSHFNRSFRHRYAATPSEVRAEAHHREPNDGR